MEMLEARLDPATFTVNTLADTVDLNPAVTSLREAITAANSQAGDDIIKFSVTGTINLTGALPEVSSNIQILGPTGALTVRRDTGGNYRIFTVVGEAIVVFDGLTISNGFRRGDDNGSFPDGLGGGIYNDGGVTVRNCTLSNNIAVSDSFGYFPGGGGGIYNGGTLAIVNSTLSGNAANSNTPDFLGIPLGGGGILNFC